MPRSPSPSRLFDPAPDAGQRNWTKATHLVGLLSALPGVVFLGLLGTTAMWLGQRHKSAFIDDHGREALNFQISIFLYSGVVALISMITDGVGEPALLLAVAGLTIYGGVRGAMAASRSAYYRYPMCFRLIQSGEAAPAPVRDASPY